MNNRPTPETDALITLRSGFGVTDYEWRQHSRKLERQRDEARELARELRDAITPFVGLNPSSPRVKAKWPDFVERANAALTKAKEVLP
jgi:ADP-heptose:LPS heptosyltransferase